MGGEGLQAIAAGMVKHNKSVVKLNMSECGISDAGLDALSKVWAALNIGLRLRSVDLAACNGCVSVCIGACATGVSVCIGACAMGV